MKKLLLLAIVAGSTQCGNSGERHDALGGYLMAAAAFPFVARLIVNGLEANTARQEKHDEARATVLFKALDECQQHQSVTERIQWRDCMKKSGAKIEDLGAARRFLFGNPEAEFKAYHTGRFSSLLFASKWLSGNLFGN